MYKVLVLSEHILNLAYLLFFMSICLNFSLKFKLHHAFKSKKCNNNKYVFSLLSLSLLLLQIFVYILILTFKVHHAFKSK